MKKWVFLVLLAFIGTWLFYYPPFFTFGDEGQYLHATWLLSQQKSPRVTDPLESFSFHTKGKDIFFPQYAIGQSILLLPFALIDWRLIFLSGLLLHLSVFFLFSSLLKQSKINPDFALLYLLFPGFVFFSRTIMSELLSIALIFLGFYFYRDEKHAYWSGFFFGLSIVARYTNAVFAIPFFIGALVKDRNKFIKMLLGFVPFILIVALYNYQIYGAILSTGIKQPRGFSFWLMGKYMFSLLIVYPLLIISPFFSKDKNRWEIFACFALALVGFSYSGIDTFHYDILKNLVIGYRYLFPIIPLLLFGYASWISKSRLNRIIQILLPFISIMLLLGNLIIMQKQYDFSKSNLDVMLKINEYTKPDSLILANGYVTSMFTNNFFEKRNAFTIRTFISNSECMNYTLCNEMINQTIADAKKLIRNRQSYLVFAESGVITKDIKPVEAPVDEVEDERQGELTITKQFNATKVYEQKEPSYIQIWEIN